jgi:hypothetical protein
VKGNVVSDDEDDDSKDDRKRPHLATCLTVTGDPVAIAVQPGLVGGVSAWDVVAAVAWAALQSL